MEGRETREWRRIELQLDTAQIVLVIASLVGLCAASFYLGRWMERDRWQEASGMTSPGGAKVGKQETVSDLTFFDTLGNRPASEPARQARSVPSRAAGSGASSATPPSAGGSGPGSRDAAPAPRTAAASPAPQASSPSGSAAAPSSPVPKAAETTGGYAVQVFAGDKAQAERLVASLARKGYAAHLLAGAGHSSTARVRVSGYRTRTEATRAADRLRKEEKLRPWVVKSD